VSKIVVGAAATGQPRQRCMPMANHLGRIMATDPPEAWQGPAIVGLTHVFADPDVERRYMSAAERQNWRRLATLIAVAALLSVVLTAAFLAPSQTTPTLHAIWPSLVQLGGFAIFAIVLSRLNGAAAVERAAMLFAVFFAATNCLELVALPDEAGGALVTGSIALIFLLLPVRLAVLAPLTACASGALVAAWSMRDPAPAPAAIMELFVWVWVLNLLGIMVVRTVRLALRTEWAQAQVLQHMRSHDGMTGVANRRFFEHALGREWVEGLRTAAPVSLVLVNVDHFRLLNDCVGYEAGDACLREACAVIEGCLAGPGDLLARIGGDEFAGLLADTGEQAARSAAERIMTALQAAAIAHPCSPIGPHVTVSIGVATARPMKFHHSWELTALADRLLCAAKQDGRNRIGQQTLGAAPPPAPPGGRRANVATASARRPTAQAKKPARSSKVPAS